jgi:hypothetical protein
MVGDQAGTAVAQRHAGDDQMTGPKHQLTSPDGVDYDVYLRSHCYACGYPTDNYGINNGNYDYFMNEYERIVEYIEALGDQPFKITSVWRGMGGGPTEYRLVQRVVRDMDKHGLLEPLKWTRSRWGTRRVLLWHVRCDHGTQ